MELEFRFRQGEISKDHTNLVKVSVPCYKFGLAHGNISTGIRYTGKDLEMCLKAITGFEYSPLVRSPLASQPFPIYSSSFLSGPVE